MVEQLAVNQHMEVQFFLSSPLLKIIIQKYLEEKMMIVTAGMIGVGKSTLAKRIAEHFGTEVFYEKVDGNEILPLFYTLSEEELLKQRIPFLLQLDFLDSRFKNIKQSLIDDNSVNDRSIYEDDANENEINKNYICTKCYKDIRKLEKCITNKYNNKY